jgi:hypothetical protein
MSSPCKRNILKTFMHCKVLVFTHLGYFSITYQMALFIARQTCNLDRFNAQFSGVAHGSFLLELCAADAVRVPALVAGYAGGSGGNSLPQFVHQIRLPDKRPAH